MQALFREGEGGGGLCKGRDVFGGRSVGERGGGAVWGQG